MLFFESVAETVQKGEMCVSVLVVLRDYLRWSCTECESRTKVRDGDENGGFLLLDQAMPLRDPGGIIYMTLSRHRLSVGADTRVQHTSL